MNAQEISRTGLDVEWRRLEIIAQNLANAGTTLDADGNGYRPLQLLSGPARSFADLARATFRALDREPDIEFFDMPEHLRDKYQYFTEADTTKLRAAGYAKPFHTLEAGVSDYVRNYLVKGLYF